MPKPSNAQRVQEQLDAEQARHHEALATVQEACTDCQAELERRKAACTALETELQRTSCSDAALASRHHQLEAEVASLRAENNNASVALEAARVTAEQQQRQLAESDAACQRASAQAASAQEQVDRLQAEVGRLRSSLAKRDDRVSELSRDASDAAAQRLRCEKLQGDVARTSVRCVDVTAVCASKTAAPAPLPGIVHSNVPSILSRY